MEHIYVALIGAGRIGRVHGPNVARHRALHQKFVVDPRLAVARFAATHGAAQTSSEQVLAHPAIRGLLICSSTDMHLRHALAAIAASTAALCEKPIDPDLDKLRATQPSFTDARFLLGFNRRFNSQLAWLKQQLRAGVARKLETLHLVNHNLSAPPLGFISISGGVRTARQIHQISEREPSCTKSYWSALAVLATSTRTTPRSIHVLNWLALSTPSTLPRRHSPQNAELP